MTVKRGDESVNISLPRRINISARKEITPQKKKLLAINCLF
jgi:hypothetical protein